MSQVHQTISEKIEEGSGKWLLMSDKFKDWESGHRRLLWCSGIRKSEICSQIRSITAANYLLIAGAGKTVLAYALVSCLKE